MYTQRMMGTAAAAAIAFMAGSTSFAEQVSIEAQLKAAEQRVAQLEQAQQGN